MLGCIYWHLLHTIFIQLFHVLSDTPAVDALACHVLAWPCTRQQYYLVHHLPHNERAFYFARHHARPYHCCTHFLSGSHISLRSFIVSPFDCVHSSYVLATCLRIAWHSSLLTLISHWSSFLMRPSLMFSATHITHTYNSTKHTFRFLRISDSLFCVAAPFMLYTLRSQNSSLPKPIYKSIACSRITCSTRFLSSRQTRYCTLHLFPGRPLAPFISLQFYIYDSHTFTYAPSPNHSTFVCAFVHVPLYMHIYLSARACLCARAHTCMRMRACVYAYARVCACARARARVFECLRACLLAWLRAFVRARALVHVLVRTCTRCAFAYAYTCVRARACVCARAYVYVPARVCVCVCVHVCAIPLTHPCISTFGTSLNTPHINDNPCMLIPYSRIHTIVPYCRWIGTWHYTINLCCILLLSGLARHPLMLLVTLFCNMLTPPDVFVMLLLHICMFLKLHTNNTIHSVMHSRACFIYCSAVASEHVCYDIHQYTPTHVYEHTYSQRCDTVSTHWRKQSSTSVYCMLCMHMR